MYVCCLQEEPERLEETRAVQAQVLQQYHPTYKAITRPVSAHTRAYKLLYTHIYAGVRTSYA